MHPPIPANLLNTGSRTVVYENVKPRVPLGGRGAERHNGDDEVMSSFGKSQGGLRLAEVAGPAVAWEELSLEDLRLYRRRLSEEEEKISYWRRLVHARIDVLEAESHHERPLRLDELSGLPVLKDWWVTELDPNDHAEVAEAIGRLREAEGQLTDYRRALHQRLDEASAELIVRYHRNPVSALIAFSTPHNGTGRGAGSP
jgi:hypothetical protein